MGAVGVVGVLEVAGPVDGAVVDVRVVGAPSAAAPPPPCVGAGAWGVVSVTAADWLSVVAVLAADLRRRAPPARGHRSRRR